MLDAHGASLDIGADDSIYPQPVQGCWGLCCIFSMQMWPWWRSDRYLSWSSGGMHTLLPARDHF